MALKDRYFTISEAAKEIGVTRQTISRWIRDGKVTVERIGRETLIDKDELRRLYDEKMFEQFSEAMKWWIRTAILDYLQKQHYVAEDSPLVVTGQSREDIRVEGKGEDGICKAFDIPIGQVELAIDTKAERLFRIKTAKVITTQQNTEEANQVRGKKKPK